MKRYLAKAYLAIGLALVLALFAASVPARAASNNVVIDVDSAQTNYTVPVGTEVWTAKHNQLPKNTFLRISLQPQPQDVVSEGLIADYLPPGFVASLNLQPGQMLIQYIYTAKTPGDVYLEVNTMAPVYDAQPHLGVISTKTIHLKVQ